MRELVVTTFVTLDGVMQAPGGPGEDPEGGFEHGGWVVPFFDEGMGRQIDEWFSRAEDFLLGRGTYEIFAAYWPHVRDEDNTVAGALNTRPKHVASRTLQRVDWEGARLLGPDVVGDVEELKRRDGGELQVHGSHGLVQTLLEHDLVDELRLLTFPLVLGTGKRLFADGAVPLGLRLADSSTTNSGVVIASYERTGAVRTGTF
ncbi:deaminase [Actinopolyspora erythraea]|uniref:Deaminase n=1 Tax=Actinopolyspora erythraea TaxID=414996 RepID=A0A099D770_9ACTN|nr:dihydrofolate reductase family protein [Actinopolyspora erythraea]ASU78877.1 deaminase [Actinopolyspora erythraea]KGI81230.1 deaminase/reductase [Actinopolyspora erythraea]